MEKEGVNLMDVRNMRFKSVELYYNGEYVKTIDDHDIIREKINNRDSPFIIVGGKILSLYRKIEHDLRTFWKIKRGDPEWYRDINLHNLTVRKIEIFSDFKVIRLTYSYRYRKLHGAIGTIEPEYRINGIKPENQYRTWAWEIG